MWQSVPMPMPHPAIQLPPHGNWPSHQPRAVCICSCLDIAAAAPCYWLLLLLLPLSAAATGDAAAATAAVAFEQSISEQKSNIDLQSNPRI